MGNKKKLSSKIHLNWYISKKLRMTYYLYYFIWKQWIDGSINLQIKRLVKLVCFYRRSSMKRNENQIFRIKITFYYFSTYFVILFHNILKLQISIAIQKVFLWQSCVHCNDTNLQQINNFIKFSNYCVTVNDTFPFIEQSGVG